MFFLYVLKEQGFPISDVFENEIKDIPTTRFSNQFDDEYKTLYHQIKEEKGLLNQEGAVKSIKGRRLKDDIFQIDKLAAMTDGYAFTDRVFGTNVANATQANRQRDINAPRGDKHSRKSSNGEVKYEIIQVNKRNSMGNQNRQANKAKGVVGVLDGGRTLGQSYAFADSDQLSRLMAESEIFNTGTFVEQQQTQ